MAYYEAMAEAARIAEGRMGLFLEALQEKVERREAEERRTAQEAAAREDAERRLAEGQPAQE